MLAAALREAYMQMVDCHQLFWSMAANNSKEIIVFKDRSLNVDKILSIVPAPLHIVWHHGIAPAKTKKLASLNPELDFEFVFVQAHVGRVVEVLVIRVSDTVKVNHVHFKITLTTEDNGQLRVTHFLVSPR
jgi:hypothetical protein